MSKIFSKEIFFVSPLLLLLSFFLLFPKNVSATVYEFTFDEAYINNLITENFLQVHQASIDYATANNYTGYFIYRDGALNFYTYFSSSNVNLPAPFNYLTNNGAGGRFGIPGSYSSIAVSCLYDFSSSSFTNCSNSNTPPMNWFSDNFVLNFSYTILYENNNFPFYLNPDYSYWQDTYIISCGNYYTSISGTDIPPMVYEIYLANQSPPTPPDNTPLLTEFFSLSIDKYSLISQYFSDNTYLYFIPLIPIFFFILYLVKRSLIK